MDDISQLRSRVAAAQQRMTSAAEEQRKYGLRLADVVRIVEGSLARQRGELEAAVSKAAQCQAERDAALSKAADCQADLDTAETRLSEIELRSTALAAQTVQLAAQNEQLRGMVMSLLQLIESRSTAPMTDALQRIEVELRGFLGEQGAAASPPAPAPAPTQAPQVELPPPPQAQSAPPSQPSQKTAAAEDLLLVDINAEPDEQVASLVAEPAGEMSPVAELIRRISEETEEIAPPSQRKA